MGEIFPWYIPNELPGLLAWESEQLCITNLYVMEILLHISALWDAVTFVELEVGA